MPYNIQISLQKLLIGLIVVIVPLSVVGLYLTANADSSLRQTVGMHFRTIAQSEALAASRFMRDRIIDVSTIARDPDIIEAVRAANRRYGGISEETLAARIQEIERQWDTSTADSLVKEMMSSRASRSPAVSMKTTGKPRMLAVSSIVSRVVPGMGETMARS